MIEKDTPFNYRLKLDIWYFLFFLYFLTLLDVQTLTFLMFGPLAPEFAVDFLFGVIGSMSYFFAFSTLGQWLQHSCCFASSHKTSA